MSENNNSQSTITATIDANIVTQIPNSMLEHIKDINNPHQVTCAQIGAAPQNPNIVIDENYNHTDNNYTDVDKNLLNTIANDYISKTKINEIEEIVDNNSSSIDNINTDIDNINTQITNINILNSSQNSSINKIQTDISGIKNTNNSIQTTLNSKADLDYVNERFDLISETSSGIYDPFAIKKNYLLNPTFSINSRGKTTYSSSFEEYTVDRWLKSKNAIVGFDKNNKLYLKNSSTEDICTLTQYIAYDIKNFENKNVTICVNTDWGEYIFSIPDTIPEDPINNCPDNLFECVDTDFGMIEFGFRTNHFYLSISLWAKSTEEDDISVILNYAKVELTKEYSGFEYPDKVQEQLACQSFYHSIDTDSMWYSGHCIKTATNTAYTIQLVTPTPMQQKPTKFFNTNAASTIQIAEQGQPPQTIVPLNFSAQPYSKDYRVFNITFNRSEDNSDLLGNETSLFFWAAMKFAGYAYESEIYD